MKDPIKDRDLLDGLERAALMIWRQMNEIKSHANFMAAVQLNLDESEALYKLINEVGKRIARDNVIEWK